MMRYIGNRARGILISGCVLMTVFFSYAAAPKETDSGTVDQMISAVPAFPVMEHRYDVSQAAVTSCAVFRENAREKIEEAREMEAEQCTEELQLLASIIFCEAGNQSFEGQVAVGAVVLNRVSSAQFPDSMEEVIYQPGQFGPVSTGWLDRVRRTAGYTDSAMRAAKAAMGGENPIGSCLYFDQGGSGKQIGAHYFH